MSRIPPVVQRFVVGGALVVAFLAMASIFVPDFSQAQTDRRTRLLPSGGDAGPGMVAPEAESGAPADVHEGLVSLGSIEGGRLTARIFGGAEEPLYSIYDTATGDVRAVLLTAEEVAESFPELPLPEMDLDGPGPLMLAEPEGTLER